MEVTIDGAEGRIRHSELVLMRSILVLLILAAKMCFDEARIIDVYFGG